MPRLLRLRSVPQSPTTSVRSAGLARASQRFIMNSSPDGSSHPRLAPLQPMPRSLGPCRGHGLHVSPRARRGRVRLFRGSCPEAKGYRQTAYAGGVVLAPEDGCRTSGALYRASKRRRTGSVYLPRVQANHGRNDARKRQHVVRGPALTTPAPITGRRALFGENAAP